MEKDKMGDEKMKLVLLAAFFALLVAIPLAIADSPFPGYFEVTPTCLATLSCGQGPNLTINGTGIINLLASPANGASDGLVTGVQVNVTWQTTTNGTGPYPMNASVYKANSSGHYLLSENSTVSASHFVQIGPFSYSSSVCPSAGCEIILVVKSCNTTSGVCINSSLENQTFSIVVAPSLYNFSFSPSSPKTGDVLTLFWNTYSSMNQSVSWSSGSSSNSSYSTSHFTQTASFNRSENPTFSVYSCSSLGACETKSEAVNISQSTSAISLSSTAPSVPITASWTTHNSSNGTFFFSVDGGAVQNSTDGNFSTAHNASVGTFSAGNAITYYVRSCLEPSNCETTDNITITVATTTTIPATTTTSSGGGGGGGGGGFGITTTSIPVPAGAEISYKQVPADLQVGFSVNGTTQAITLVSLTYGQYVPNATILLQKLGTWSLVSPPGTLYQYVNLTHYNIDEDELVPPVKIEFKVLKQWVVDNNIDRSTITLYRFSGGSWQALETVFSGEDTLNYYFRSSSPGLSVFAITGLPRTAFWDLISLIEAYYAGDPGVDFWKVLDALTAYYSSGGSF